MILSLIFLALLSELTDRLLLLYSFLLLVLIYWAFAVSLPHDFPPGCAGWNSDEAILLQLLARVKY